MTEIPDGLGGLASDTSPTATPSQVANLDVVFFLGTCDVCGNAIAYKWDRTQGIIDYMVTTDGRMQTWIRHFATAPEHANPDCAVYSSKVWEITPPQELSQRLVSPVGQDKSSKNARSTHD